MLMKYCLNNRLCIACSEGEAGAGRQACGAASTRGIIPVNVFPVQSQDNTASGAAQVHVSSGDGGE